MSLKHLLGLAAVLALGSGACRTVGATVSATEIWPGDTLTKAAPTPADSVRFWIEAPREVRRGEPVPLTLKVQNLLSRSVTLVYGGHVIRFDVVVARPDGTPVWSESRSRGGIGYQSILSATTIRPGQVLEVPSPLTWDQQANNGKPVPSGTYSVHGVLVSVDGRPKTEARPLQIRP